MFYELLHKHFFLISFGYLALGVSVVVSLQKLRKQKRDLAEAEKAHKLRAEFLINMSHEIRTPLTGIIGIVDLMEAEGLSESDLEKRSILKTGANALLTLVSDLLDFSALEAGRVRLEHADFDLSALIETVLSTFSYAAQAKGIYLRLEFPAGDNWWVHGDPTRVRQILINLVGNAVKFTSRGGVVVRIAREKHEAGEARYLVSIHDTGIGIHQEQQPYLFEFFSQAEASISRRYGGSGLGLAISKSLVELMGGEIGVQSEPDNGARFFFSIVSKEKDPGFRPGLW